MYKLISMFALGIACVALVFSVDERKRIDKLIEVLIHKKYKD